MGTSFKRSCVRTAALSAPSPAAGHCQPMPPPETPGHSWASLGQALGGHCSFLLGPGAHRVLFVPSKCLFPQSCVSSVSSMVGLMVTSNRAYATARSAVPRAPAPCSRPLLTRTSVGDTQTLKGRSNSVSVGFPGAHNVLFEPSESLWWVWGLILNVISPFLLSCWGFFFAFGCGVYPHSCSSATQPPLHTPC